MPFTFYQCYQEYLQRPDSFIFSKKKLKKLSNGIKFLYDRRNVTFNKPISYIESQEGDQTYQVRLYPDSFKNTVIGLINRLHEKQYLVGIQFAKEVVEKLKDKPGVLPFIESVAKDMVAADKASKEIKLNRVRKRKPIQKPEFSAKPTP